MKQRNITVTKTARYFVSGELSESTEQLWFVCHGYAQLANAFLEWFDVLDKKKNLIVAPEGLHRFYWKGFSEKVVASWMTKEDREDDIADYVNFLNKVYDEVTPGNKKLVINVLGFSQGTATVCRWVAKGHVRPDNLILWAGSVPPDLDIFKGVNTYVVLGDADEFIPEQEAEKQLALLDAKEIRYELIRFQGRHEVDKKTLLLLSEKLR
ncbi:MAG: alpha/beta hydrolase [Bacteroidia bacterium]